MRAAWFVRGRQASARLKYWLAIAGYDKNDRSISHRIYLVYAAIFFSIWWFSVLSLMAGWAVTLMSSMGLPSAPLTATALQTLGLLAWALYQAWRASRRSPLVFSEDDAVLVCMTPIPRQAVAFAWLLGDWPFSTLALWAVAAVLGFARVEAALSGKVTLLDLPQYAGAGLSSFFIAMLLTFALQAWVWALGALRLRGSRSLQWLPLAVLALAAALAGGLFFSGSGSLLGRVYNPPWSIALAPLSYPLSAGMGLQPFGPGLLAGAALIASGVLALSLASSKLSLNRAAQETSGAEAQQALSLFGFSGQAAQMALQRRLGAAHHPAAPARRNGWGALLWKVRLQTRRGFSAGLLMHWLFTTFTMFGAAAAPDWGARAWALLIWVVLTTQQGADYFRADLTRWPLFRTLPVSSHATLLAEVTAPVIISTLLSMLGLAAGLIVTPPLPSSPITAWTLLLLPALTASFAFTGCYDVARQSRSGQLLAGNVPPPGSAGMLISALIALAGFGAAAWLIPLTGAPLANLLALGLLIALARLMHSIAVRYYRGIK